MAGIADSIRVGSSLLAEFYALKLGLMVVVALKLNRVVIEVDSKALFQMITSTASHCPVEVSVLLKDINKLLAQIPTTTLSWTYREANRVADALAGHASSIAMDDQWWTNYIPTRPLDYQQISNVVPSTCSFWWLHPPSFLFECLDSDLRGVKFERMIRQ
ncbi:hypothetical protein IFM89_022724 [Coptis chinensis]|uniref:RNase H type-1 domain-containing protein n=1 Tax=Coptis chinensis TaxID=261450 RepID=A0A835M0P7_9MAGN|nr:hypothetical protein IFM89_022724 [Coptis chinensis]